MLATIAVLLLLFNQTQTPLIGGDIVSDAAPSILMAAPPTGLRLYLQHLQCAAIDGVDNPGNLVTLNDSKNTVVSLVPTEGTFTEQDFSPPLVGPIGGALTFQISQPSVVKCNGRGYVGP